MTSTAIVSSRHAFEPNNTDEAFTLSQRLVASRLLPKAVTTPEAAFAIILAGREFGISALQSIRSIHIIDGKISLSADLMLALARRSDSCVYFRCITSTNEVATMETKRLGDDEPVRMSFSLADAVLAGLAQKDTWRKYPAAMLRARCIAALARFVYPDIFLGVYEDSELASITTEGHAVHDEPARVAVTVTSSTQGPPKSDLVHNFLDRIDAAPSAEALVAVGRDIGARKNEIGATGMIGLQQRYLDRRAVFAADAMAAKAAEPQPSQPPPQPPPTREPGDDSDEDPPPPPPAAAQAEAAA